jgi:hypothetical protein
MVVTKEGQKCAIFEISFKTDVLNVGRMASKAATAAISDGENNQLRAADRCSGRHCGGTTESDDETDGAEVDTDADEGEAEPEFSHAEVEDDDWLV